MSLFSPLRVVAAVFCLCSMWQPTSLHAQGMHSAQNSQPDFGSDQSADYETLLLESQSLLMSGRPIDARAKLQQAMGINPNDFRVHMYLGQYYLFEVAHFKLAAKYLRNAEKLFMDAYGPDEAVPEDKSRYHLMLLYLLSESHLNLDQYEESLATLDRIEGLYVADWYPGTRAWVLMKLKRIDEAIAVAQAGLLHRSDPERTWNILGILLSVSGNREASLEAFGNAIKAELSGLGNGQVATPLNNAGEVYREMFKDPLAEASWRQAVGLPDGCDHILPSLNLSMLYIEQLRLFQAERTLRNFEACFAQKPEREDSEHRTLLALSRGQIALHRNKIDEAIRLISVARQDQQWFGKIGTNQNDVELAAMFSMARAYRAKAESLRDLPSLSLWEATQNAAQRVILLVRAAWLERQSFRYALQELENFEDLFIRNTDTLLEYPSIAGMLRWVPTDSVERRMERMMQKDTRPMAANFYKLYLASALVASGENSKAKPLLKELRTDLRDSDRLARAEVLAQEILLAQDERSWWSTNTEKLAADYQNREQLYALHPFLLRYYGIALPVQFTIEATSPAEREFLQDVLGNLRAQRFMKAEGGIEANSLRYSLALAATPGNDDSTSIVSLHLLDTARNRTVVSEQVTAEMSDETRVQVVRSFIRKAFAHQADAPGPPLPRVPILEGVLSQ